MHDNNDNNLSKIEKLIKDNKVFAPISDKIERKIRRSERKNYIKLMKKTGQYTFLLGLTSYIIFFFKKFGMIMSTIQGYITLGVVTVTVAGGSTAAYYYLNKENRVEIKKVIDSGLVEPEKETIKVEPKKPVKKPEPKAILFKKPIILIDTFESEYLSQGELRKISGKIARELKRLRGSASIKSKIGNEKDYVVLKAMVDMVDNEKTIDVKIYDVKKMQYIFYTSESTSANISLDKICKNIARKINAKLK